MGHPTAPTVEVPALGALGQGRLGIIGLKVVVAGADSMKVRPWISLLFVAGAVALAIRHALGHRHSIAIPLLLLPALVLGVQEYRFREDVALFSDVATHIAGRPVTIQCQRLSGAMLDVTGELGYVMFDAEGHPADVGRIERDACNDLRSYVHSDKDWPTLDQVIGVAVLSHESNHLAGELNESRTECSSIQDLSSVAQELGAGADQALRLTDRYVADVYPNMPAEYVSVLCAQDSEWDLTPGDGVWP